MNQVENQNSRPPIFDYFLGGNGFAICKRGLILILAGFLIMALRGFSDNADFHRVMTTLGSLLYGPGVILTATGLLYAAFKEQHHYVVKAFMLIGFIFLILRLLFGDVL